jgi:hypothetical protein
MHFEPVNLKWLLILLLALVPSVLGAVVPVSLIEQAKRKPRPHHIPKMWNEALAKHQFAYSGYFFTLIFAGKFSPTTLIWMQPFMQLGIILAFAFWFFSVKSLVRQEAKIATLHPGGQCPQSCTLSLKAWDFIRLCWSKFAATAILIGMSFCAATSAVA